MTHSTITSVLIAAGDTISAERSRPSHLTIKFRGDSGWSTLELDGSVDGSQIDEIIDRLAALRSPQEVKGVGADAREGTGGEDLVARTPTPDTPTLGIAGGREVPLSASSDPATAAGWSGTPEGVSA